MFRLKCVCNKRKKPTIVSSSTSVSVYIIYIYIMAFKSWLNVTQINYNIVISFSLSMFWLKPHPDASHNAIPSNERNQSYKVGQKIAQVKLWSEPLWRFRDYERHKPRAARVSRWQHREKGSNSALIESAATLAPQRSLCHSRANFFFLFQNAPPHMRTGVSKSGNPLRCLRPAKVSRHEAAVKAFYSSNY